MTERSSANLPVSVTNMAAQECIALADMIQLELGRKCTDVMDQLVNNDFEGDFFRIGDTVQVVSINPNSIKVVQGDKNDIRPTLDALEFGTNYMTIDKQQLYGFQIKDLERIEDRWNHESAAHALAARKMREATCLDVLNLIANNKNIRCLGTIANPINLATVGGGDVGNGVFKLVNRMKAELKKVGAIDQGGQYTFGANKTVQLRGTASLFVPTSIYTELLSSQYVRHDDVTEDVIRNGKYEKIGGFLLNEAPELEDDNVSDIHVDFVDGQSFGLIIMGTKNLVTRAGKVLPPEKLRDQVHFADNYYGREIYGEMVACPEAAIIAIVTIPNDGIGAAAKRADATYDKYDTAQLFTSYAQELPTEANDAEDRFPANEGYAAQDLSAYAKTADLGDLATKDLADIEATSTFTYNADTPADSTVTTTLDEVEGE